MFILAYVDYILVTGNFVGDILYIISKLNQAFPVKDIGKLHYFLSIEAKRTSTGGILLSQTKYITNLLTKANMLKAKPMLTYMVSRLKLFALDSSSMADPQHYRSIEGAVQYATITQPEITFQYE